MTFSIPQILFQDHKYWQDKGKNTFNFEAEFVLDCFVCPPKEGEGVILFFCVDPVGGKLLCTSYLMK